MVAFPDNPKSYVADRIDRDRKPAGCALKRALKMALGTAFLMAAIGMWVVPAGDAPMQMIKLFVSMVMLGLGLMLMSSLDQSDDLPEVHIDTMNGQLRLMTTDSCGRLRLSTVYDLDTLSDISLEGRSLTACDAAGHKVVSVPLCDAESEQQLREVLPQAA
jgi:heme A synthase